LDASPKNNAQFLRIIGNNYSTIYKGLVGGLKELVCMPIHLRYMYV